VATPTPVAVTPDAPPPAKHPAKPAKVKHHENKHHDKKPHKPHHQPHADKPVHGQQAAVDKSNRGHKSRRRLRISRSPR
jgi:uncharacterized protein involved in copper resistance